MCPQPRQLLRVIVLFQCGKACKSDSSSPCSLKVLRIYDGVSEKKGKEERKGGGVSEIERERKGTGSQ